MASFCQIDEAAMVGKTDLGIGRDCVRAWLDMAKPQINRPRPDITAATYQAECKFALEPSFLSLRMLAAEAGWEPTEIAHALHDLSLEAILSPGAPEQPV